MNIAASIISLLMTLLPFVLRLLLYINCIIPTKARNGCRLAPECVCVCVWEREREQLSHPATSIHPCVGGMRLNPTFAPSQRERERDGKVDHQKRAPIMTTVSSFSLFICAFFLFWFHPQWFRMKPNFSFLFKWCPGARFEFLLLPVESRKDIESQDFLPSSFLSSFHRLFFFRFNNFLGVGAPIEKNLEPDDQ